MSDRDSLPCGIVKRSPGKRRVRKKTPFVDSDEDLDHVDESVIGDDGEDGLDDEEDSLVGDQGPLPQFKTVAQGPLGALSIINNRQLVEQQIREMDDLLHAVKPHHEQVEKGIHGQEWPELHATLDTLIKKKAQVRKRLEELTKTNETNYNELADWMKKFSSIAEFSSDKLFTLRDKLPPNLGLALIRLIAFYYPDEISMDQLPNWYKEMLHTDLQRLAKSSVPPVPSQSIPALKTDLQSASERTKKLEDEVKRKDARIEEIQLQLDMRSSEVASLNERLKSLRNRYEGGSSRLSQVQVERKRADELQRQLSEANDEIKAPERASGEASKQQDFIGEKLEDLMRRIDGLKVSNTETVDGMENIKNAMVVATSALNNAAEVIGQFRSQWSPKMRRVESSVQELGATNKDLQLLEQKWSGRLRDEKASAEAKKADLIYAFREQSNEAHKAELADLRLRHEVEREADRAALSDARSGAERLRVQLSGALEVRTSPERRRKRVRGDAHGDDVLCTPLSSAQASRAATTQSELSMWQVALDTANKVWRSFEPVILTDDISYSYLIGHLSFAITTEENIGRFREFLNSNAEGWYCATAVIKLGYKDEKSKRAEGCVFSEKHNKGHCTGLRKVSTTRKLEVKIF